MSQTKTYYSRIKGLVFYSGPSTRLIQNGMAVTIDSPEIAFSPMGSSDYKDGWGQFTTDDPALIAACEKRRVEQGDIFGPEEFNKKMKPVAEQLEDSEVKMKRLIEDNNRLTALLERQGSMPRAQK